MLSLINYSMVNESLEHCCANLNDKLLCLAANKNLGHLDSSIIMILHNINVLRMIQIKVQSKRQTSSRDTAGSTTIQFGANPFSIGEKRIMECQHRQHYYKPRKSANTQIWLQGTQRKGCTAHIVKRQYILYPEYSIIKDFESKRQEQLAKGCFITTSLPILHYLLCT